MQSKRYNLDDPSQFNAFCAEFRRVVDLWRFSSSAACRRYYGDAVFIACDFGCGAMRDLSINEFRLLSVVDFLTLRGAVIHYDETVKRAITLRG